MKRIMLHGELGRQYGESWDLDVRTPAEAVFAINVNRPGFTRHLIDSARDGVSYQILLDDQELDPAALQHPFGPEVFHLVPVLQGASADGRATTKVVIGAVIAIASVGIGMAAYGGGAAAMGAVVTKGAIGAAMAESALLGMSYGTIALMGASLMFGGISQLLAQTPKDAMDANKAGSFAFTGPQNTTAQGGPIPVGYGELMVGSVVISAGIRVSGEAIS